MTPPPDLSSLDPSDKDALIVALLARVDEVCARTARLEAENAALRARVAELEAKLGLPPKTPDNSSTPPSLGRKASGEMANKPKGKPHAGAHRPLHPNPNSKRDLFASSCQHCGADVSQRPQVACEAYDHVEIPDIRPDITRVTRHGGVCPCCGKRFKAPAPADMAPGSPFGPNLRAFVIYLRFTQGIAFERLARLLSDLLGLDISEGALINMLAAARDAFSAQATAIRSRLLCGTALDADMRKGFGSLALLVQETLKRNPHDGNLFVFRGRRGDLLKIIWHDGQGACLFTNDLSSYYTSSSFS